MSEFFEQSGANEPRPPCQVEGFPIDFAPDGTEYRRGEYTAFDSYWFLDDDELRAEAFGLAIAEEKGEAITAEQMKRLDWLLVVTDVSEWFPEHTFKSWLPQPPDKDQE